MIWYSAPPKPCAALLLFVTIEIDGECSIHAGCSSSVCVDGFACSAVSASGSSAYSGGTGLLQHYGRAMRRVGCRTSSLLQDCCCDG